MIRFFLALLALPVLAGAIAAGGTTSLKNATAPVANAAETRKPTLVQDTKASTNPLSGGPTAGGPDSIQDYIQPDTEIEPSGAVNPKNPKNVVAVYQDRRIADGGDATNGFATSLDGGKTWTSGTLPGLTNYPGQGGVFERASDAVVAFGPDGTVYATP